MMAPAGSAIERGVDDTRRIGLGGGNSIAAASITEAAEGIGHALAVAGAAAVATMSGTSEKVATRTSRWRQLACAGNQEHWPAVRYLSATGD